MNKIRGKGSYHKIFVEVVDGMHARHESARRRAHVMLWFGSGFGSCKTRDMIAGTEWWIGRGSGGNWGRYNWNIFLWS